MEITNSQNFVDYYSKIKRRTRRLFDIIPKEQIEWTYRPDKFTFGDLIRHMALIERYMFAENVQLKPSKYRGCDITYAEGKENVVKLYDKLWIESKNIFLDLSTNDLKKKCITPADVEITVWKWLRAMVEHEIHHRGQIYLYLNLLEINTPPLYGLTSEEVGSKSI